jgi:hypothetical protein
MNYQDQVFVRRSPGRKTRNTFMTIQDFVDRNTCQFGKESDQEESDSINSPDKESEEDPQTIHKTVL